MGGVELLMALSHDEYMERLHLKEVYLNMPDFRRNCKEHLLPAPGHGWKQEAGSDSAWVGLAGLCLQT